MPGELTTALFNHSFFFSIFWSLLFSLACAFVFDRDPLKNRDEQRLRQKSVFKNVHAIIL